MTPLDPAGDREAGAGGQGWGCLCVCVGANFKREDLYNFKESALKTGGWNPVRGQSRVPGGPERHRLSVHPIEATRLQYPKTAFG